jgi:hypothetical protein
VISSASEFLSLASLKRGKVQVRGSEVNIRELTVAEREKMIELARKSSSEAQAFLIRSCVTDDSGASLFSDEQAADISKSAPEVVDKVGAAILRLSGLDDDSKNA